MASKKINKNVDQILKVLREDYVVIGTRNVRSWYAWLSIGVAVGIFAAIVFVANRQGEFELGQAQVLTITYNAGTDFSSTQGSKNWYYLDGAGTMMSFDSALGRWKSTSG